MSRGSNIVGLLISLRPFQCPSLPWCRDTTVGEWRGIAAKKFPRISMRIKARILQADILAESPLRAREAWRLRYFLGTSIYDVRYFFYFLTPLFSAIRYD